MEERNINQYDFDSSYAQAGLTLNQYVARTFGWMFVGLMITFLLAAVLAMTGAVVYLFVNPYIPMVLLIAELVVVLVLSAGILKRPVGVTRVLFAVYSILNGLVFSAYFVIYDVANLVVIFGLTALFFGAFSLYGRFTKTDLSKLRPLLIGGLIFVMVSVLNAAYVIALQNTTLSTQYMLYRYIATGQYANAPVDYVRLMIPSMITGAIGLVLFVSYVLENRKKGE